MHRIAIDARGAVWFRGTGIGTYIYHLLKELVNFDLWNEYHLFWPEGEEKIPFMRYIFQGIPVLQERLKEQARIAQYMREKEIQLYHLPQNGVGYQNISREHNLVVTIHDLIPYILPQTCHGSYLRRFLQSVPKALERAEMLITVSHHTRQDLVSLLKIPPEKIAVIYEAPDEMFHPMDAAVVKKGLEAYKISPGYLLYLGGFSPRKNLLLLVEAYQRLIKEGTDLPVMVLAGNQTGQYQLLASLVEKYGLQEKIVFPGYVAVNDLPALYNGARMFIYPSIYEGFGLPPLEAMACGVPTIASRTSSIPEIVENGAWLVDPYCPDELSTAIEFLFANPEQANELAARGKRRAAEFTWGKTAYQTLLVYESILNAR
ncbi:MAG: glycosyltransferase family 4 protein [Bacillota bacterium]